MAICHKCCGIDGFCPVSKMFFQIVKPFLSFLGIERSDMSEVVAVKVFRFIPLIHKVHQRIHEVIHVIDVLFVGGLESR